MTSLLFISTPSHLIAIRQMPMMGQVWATLRTASDIAHPDE